MRLWKPLLSLAALGAMALAAPGGAVAAPTAATCSFTYDVRFQPGVSLEQGSGTAHSIGPGRLDCVGLIDGKLVKPGGQMTIRNDWQGSCLLTNFSGTVNVQVPLLTGGTITTTGTMSGITGVNGGTFTMQLEGWGTMTGPLTGLALEGSCLPGDSIRASRNIAQLASLGL